MALSFGFSVPEHQTTNKVHERALRVVLNDIQVTSELCCRKTMT